MLAVQGAQVQSPVRELDPHAAARSSHTPQQRPEVLWAAAKTRHSQINNLLINSF